MMYDGQKIKRARFEEGLSGQELAERAGVCLAIVYRTENGRSQGFATIKKIAAALGRKPGDFLKDEEVKIQ